MDDINEAIRELAQGSDVLAKYLTFRIERQHYVTGIGKLDKYTVLLLNSRLLFSDADMGQPCQSTI